MRTEQRRPRSRRRTFLPLIPAALVAAAASGPTGRAEAREEAAPAALAPDQALAAALTASPGAQALAAAAPAPTDSYLVGGKRLEGYGRATLFQNGAYDHPIVIAEPFNSDEANPAKGPRSTAGLYLEMNGNPHLLGFGTGVLERLAALGFDVWLVQPFSTGQTIHEQAAEYAQALQIASTYGGAATPPVAFGFSLGGLVVRVATSRWANDSLFRLQLGLGDTMPANLIVAGDAPLHGALVNYELQYLIWDKGQQVYKNMHNCASQQMLENSRYQLGDRTKAWSDNHWYATYQAGWDFDFYHEGEGANGLTYRYCENEGVAIDALPWPAGVKRIGWTQGTPTTDTNQCFNDYRDRNGDYLLRDPQGRSLAYDVCPDVGVNSFGYGTPFARIDIDLWPDTQLRYHQYGGNYKTISELEPGSKHDAIISQGVINTFIGWDVDLEQIRHVGTFIPARSALDAACAGCAPGFDDYWHHSYNATHRGISNQPGRHGQSVVDWALGHIGQAGGCVPHAGQACDGADGDLCTEGRYACDGSCTDASETTYEQCGDSVDNDCNGQVDEGCPTSCWTCFCPDGSCANWDGYCPNGQYCYL